jgi:hypothetical protein
MQPQYCRSENDEQLLNVDNTRYDSTTWQILNSVNGAQSA